MDCSIYQFIILHYIGLLEQYLFGFFIDFKWIDICNYNYYDDIINVVLNTIKLYDTSIGSNYEELRNYCGKILAELF